MTFKRERKKRQYRLGTKEMTREKFEEEKRILEEKGNHKIEHH
jgi:hypothetical protein